MKKYNNWREEHYNVISNLLQFINKNSDSYILKGGTALLYCYNLDRFSEDIDLDGTHSKNFKKILDEFCKVYNYTYRVAKDTDIVKRYMINYNDENRPLKVEISYRRKEILSEEVTKINSILVYTIKRFYDIMLAVEIVSYRGDKKWEV